MYHFAVQIPAFTQAFILASVVAIVALLHLSLRRLVGAQPFLWKATGMLCLYLLLIAGLSVIGVFEDFSLPPRIIAGAFLTIVVLILISIYFRQSMHRMTTERHETGIKNFTLSGLTMVQVWRILPETIILLLIQNGIMPEVMTFTGRNFDIFAPLTAPLMAMMIRRESPARIRILLVWNVICSLILIVTVAHGVLATPTPLRIIFSEIPNAAIGSFPATMLPVFMVPLAFVIHGWSIRICMNRLTSIKEHL